nr:NBS-containing resistance-like protein [Tanacetum cinerariifolium]
MTGNASPSSMYSGNNSPTESNDKSSMSNTKPTVSPLNTKRSASGLFLSQSKVAKEILESTFGYCVFLCDNLLSWSAKWQVTLSRSSTETEYRGVANVVAETAWIRNLLLELHAPLSTATLVYCDNVSVVYLSTNPRQHQRTKHIEIDIHFVREYVASGQKYTELGSHQDMVRRKTRMSLRKRLKNSDQWVVTVQMPRRNHPPPLEGSSSFVDLVADKFFNIKSTKWEKMNEQQDSYIQLKNRELDIQEAACREATELKREKHAIQRRTLELTEKIKRDKDILFYNSEISPLCPQFKNRSCKK